MMTNDETDRFKEHMRRLYKYNSTNSKSPYNYEGTVIND